MNFSFKKEEEKFKVGRPKLADTKQKKINKIRGQY